MSALDAAMVALHLLFGALWVGSVAFVTLSILPLARDGDLAREPLSAALGRLVWISRLSALVLVLTGSHRMAEEGYFETDVLFETEAGWAVLAMLALWLVLIAIVEVAGRRIRSGLDANLLREPARDGLRWFWVATIVGALAFVVGAVLATGLV